MAKNKRAKKVTMRDVMQDAAKGVANKGNTAKEAGIQVDDKYFSSEYNEKLNVYNKDIANFHKNYTDIRPVSKILVRAFVNPMEEENGVLIPNKVVVKAPTQAGLGAIGEVDNPFPFINKAIIVNLPSILNPELAQLLSVGDIVSVNQDLVAAKPIGKGHNAAVTLDRKYVHPDEVGKYDGGIVTEPDDDNYGYFLLDPYSIDVILERVTL